MALTSAELNQWVQDKIKTGRLAWTEQNDVSFWRGLHHKYDYQLLAVIEQYKDKYQRLVERYKEYLDDIQGKITNFDISQADLKDELLSLKDKVIRLADKYWAVKWEIEGRRLDIFKRKPVGTVYYIDLDGGNDGNDGLSTGNAWLTIEKYTTVTVRSAGDIAYVRANTDETVGAADIILDEDGTQDSFISIIGCDSVTNDPWSDGSDVKPIIDFNAGAYSVRMDNDDFWYFERLVITGSGDNGFEQARTIFSKFKSCEFTDNVVGVSSFLRSEVFYEGCIFSDNTTTGIDMQAGIVQLDECTFDGGAGGQTYGIRSWYGGFIEANNCDFGQANAHGSNDIYVSYNARVKLRDCRHNNSFYFSQGGMIFEEDADGVYDAGKMQAFRGTVTKQASPITGNATQSYKMEPSAYCGLYNSLGLHADSLIDSTFIIEGTASEEITITIKMQAEDAWATYPTNTQLYIEASYYDSAVDAGRSTVKSTQVISAEDTWTDFSVTLTPLRDGPIYVNVYLKKYEAGKSVTVNGEAVTS